MRRSSGPSWLLMALHHAQRGPFWRTVKDSAYRYDPGLLPVAAGRLAAFVGGRRICGKGLGIREVDTSKQRRACEQSCDDLLHGISLVAIRKLQRAGVLLRRALTEQI